MQESLEHLPGISNNSGVFASTAPGSRRRFATFHQMGDNNLYEVLYSSEERGLSGVEAKFSVGQIVRHRKFDYRGVVADVDASFQGTEEWYEHMAKSRPPKDRPWYTVLVDERGIETYVAERHLEPAGNLEPINHPLVSVIFDGLRDGFYVLSRASN